MTSYEAGQANQRIPDEEVLIFATQQNRIVITLNRDDFIRLHRSNINHAGIIICKDDRDYVEQTNTLDAYLKEDINLSNRFIRIKKQNQPKSSQQIFIVQEYRR
ncbi:hypothetical protein NIES4071_94870 [Calothrix sp. NIES-4071]|nr:hypothetical protein NIES4071_94870 [Calothrix sp. NIES-4071]BAZ63752.1 hypothetical protein NIES4105_94800 [Calothrix sp. NIES-4105]